jgi:hypothetical protein
MECRRSPWRRWALMGTAVFAAFALASLLAWRRYEKTDPLVHGCRMSFWTYRIIAPMPSSYNYGYPAPFREIFHQYPEAAVTHLIAAIRYKPSRQERFREHLADYLPGSFGDLLRPPRQIIVGRWRAVLALSDLVRERPDPRVAEFFVECMLHENPEVRKVAAFEARPHLDAFHPNLAIQVLNLALEDKDRLVRRDACRRLAQSATTENPEYAKEAQKLRFRLQRITVDGDSEVARYAAQALKVLATSSGITADMP